MQINRRTLIGGLAASIVAPVQARAATVMDGAGRAVPIPRAAGSLQCRLSRYSRGIRT
jgi:hypothetical protein